MKVDFHLHTPSSEINGDAINWSSSMDTIKRIHSNKVAAFAFTDHNIFSAERFREAKHICGHKLIVFPGIEINILKENDCIAHLIVLFDNNVSDEEAEEIEEISKRQLRKQGIRICQINKIFKKFKTILIPHVGKGDHFKVGELDFTHDAIETTSYNNNNYINWKNKLNNKSVVAFSDTHVWKSYPQNDYLETFIDFDGTFDGLKKELSRNKNFTKEK